MAKKDYKAMASGIIKQAGGADNIVSATHCMTRLRLVLRDKSKFDTCLLYTSPSPRDA